MTFFPQDFFQCQNLGLYFQKLCWIEFFWRLQNSTHADYIGQNGTVHTDLNLTKNLSTSPKGANAFDRTLSMQFHRVITNHDPTRATNHSTNTTTEHSNIAMYPVPSDQNYTLSKISDVTIDHFFLTLSVRNRPQFWN